MGHKGTVLYTLRMTDNLVKKNMDQLVRQSESGLTMMQMWVLGFIYYTPRDLYQRDVEKEFHINRATASGMLSLMEQKGMIRRSSVSHDARLKKLELTPLGRELHESHMKQRQQLEDTIEGSLTREELETFQLLMGKIHRVLEEQVQNDRGGIETV